MEKLKPQQIVRQLSDAILRGELSPGVKLTEQGLAQRLNVSRAPLREALFRLEERQLIERTPYSGMRVAQLRRETLLEHYEVREVLEGRAAWRAAERATQEDLAILEEIVTAGHQSILEISARRTFDARALPAAQDMHIEIARMSGNGEILRLLNQDVWRLIRLAHLRWNRSQARLLKGAEEHLAIYRAIAARDPELAEILMIRHIRSARDGLFEAQE